MRAFSANTCCPDFLRDRVGTVVLVENGPFRRGARYRRFAGILAFLSFDGDRLGVAISLGRGDRMGNNYSFEIA